MSRIRDSFFLKRILALLLAALLLWAVFTSLLYNSITRPVMVEMKSRDLLPQAHWVASLAANNSYTLDPTIENLVNVSYNFFTVWTMIYYQDRPSLSTELPETLSTDIREAIMNESISLHASNLTGVPIPAALRSFPGYKGEFLFVSTPIRISGSDTAKEEVIGTVVMVQPLTELDLSLRSLNISLLLSAIIVGIFLLIPAFFATRFMIRPLARIRNIAQAVTRGDFSLRAEESGNNEITDLARAMNHMSERISQSLNQLTLERNQLRQIIDGIAEGIVAVDQDGKITQLNNVLYHILQRDPRAVQAEELLHAHGIDAYFKQCLETGEIVRDTLLLVKDQKRIFCQITPLYDGEGRTLAAVGLFRDVTESERLEQTRRDYIANVSHELRTPITAMRALLEPLNDNMVKCEEDRRRYYGILLRETLRLSRLIDDMLELSRLQSGTSSLRQEPLDAEHFLENTTQHLAMMADEHGLNFKVERPEKQLPLLWGNEDRIEQILIIYLDNAIKFTPAGGNIRFIIREEAKRLVFAIQDNGRGISPDVLPFVFDRFYKADRAHNESGTGLGLSLAKAIAERLGMDVSVHSVLGEGASFSLAVPYAEEILRGESHIKDVFDSEYSPPEEKQKEAAEKSEKKVKKKNGRRLFRSREEQKHGGNDPS